MGGWGGGGGGLCPSRWPSVEDPAGGTSRDWGGGGVKAEGE